MHIYEKNIYILSLQFLLYCQSHETHTNKDIYEIQQLQYYMSYLYIAIFQMTIFCVQNEHGFRLYRLN